MRRFWVNGYFMITGLFLFLSITGCSVQKTSNSSIVPHNETYQFSHSISDLKVEDLPDTFAFKFIKEIEPVNGTEAEKLAYDAAYDLWYNDEPLKSSQAFVKFITDFADSRLMDDVYYMLGQCYLSLDEYNAALNAFSSVIVEYPSSDKIAYCYYNIGYTYKFGLKDQERALRYYLEALRYVSRENDDIYLLVLPELRTKTSVKISFDLDYEILDSVDMISGGTYGDVLIKSVTNKTSKKTLDDMFTLISAYEGFREMSLYKTEEAYKANFSESYLVAHPNALDDGYIGSIKLGKITYWKE